MGIHKLLNNNILISPKRTTNQAVGRSNRSGRTILNKGLTEMLGPLFFLVRAFCGH